MASITKRNGSYRISVSNGYDSSGKKILHTQTWSPPPGMTEKKAAKEVERIAIEFENSIKRGLMMGGTITLAAFSERWLTEHVGKQLADTTAASYRHELETKILPALGHMRLNSIQPVHVMSFLEQLSKPGIRLDGKSGAYSTRTIKYQFDILSSLFKSAVYWQILEASPCDRVKPPARKDAGQERIKHFTDEQAIVFLNAVQSEPLKYQLLATLGIYVGSRRGEVLALKWSDVNLDKGEIDISKQHAYLPDKGIFTKDTKTHGSSRIVSIPSSVVALLREHRVEQVEQRFKLGDQWEDNNLIFTQWNGKPMHTATPRQWLTKFLTRYNERIASDADISPNDKEVLTLPLIPYHGLRHTSATLLIAGNADIKTVSARLGHTLTSTTADVYSHQLRTADRKAADLLENTLTQNSKKGQAV